MENIVVDCSSHIVSSARVRRIYIGTAVCTEEQFENAKDDLQKLVTSGEWKPAHGTVDTSIFTVDLEAAMGETEIRERGSCKWNRTKLIGKNDFPHRTILRAIQCTDTKNQKYYVIGVFKWE